MTKEPDKKRDLPISRPSSKETAEVTGTKPEIEGYKIIGRLSEGGMGVVWRAVQLSTRREVALKIMGEATFGSEKAQARFQREVEIAARLEHPNIARVYDSGLHHRLYYYAMELVDGLDLETYAKQHGFTQRQVLELMRIVCQAVQYAHRNGVIHRDLKPSNILVTQDGQPHVLDFGLAKALTERDSDLEVSIEGEVIGTLPYMSPEQAAGHHDRLDMRTDVYALGVILYRLLTGESPHDLSGSHYTVMHRIAEEEIRSPRLVCKHLDVELELLLLKALAREPEDRYKDAGDLAQDIDRYLHNERVTAKPPTRTYVLHKLMSKYHIHAAIACLIFITLLGLVIAIVTSDNTMSTEDLGTWLAFDVVSDTSVCVYTYSKPYYERDPLPWGPTRSKCQPEGLKSKVVALTFARDRIEDQEHHPLRIDILRNSDGLRLSEELKHDIDQIIAHAKPNMNSIEVRLDPMVRRDVDYWEVVLKQGKSYWKDVPETVHAGQELLVSIKDMLKQPEQLPFRAYIEFDEISNDLAEQYFVGIDQVAKELGIEAQVKVERLRYAFGKRKPVETLNSWLRLIVANSRVHASGLDKTSSRLCFYVRDYHPHWIKLMSSVEVLEHIANLARNEASLPLRVDIMTNRISKGCAEELYQQIIRLVRDMKIGNSAEVYLNLETEKSIWIRRFLLIDGKAYNPTDEYSYDPDRILENASLRRPMALPMIFAIYFDRKSEDLAIRIAKDIQERAKELGVEPVVDVALIEVKMALEQDLNKWLELVIWDHPDYQRGLLFEKYKPYIEGHQGRSHTDNRWMSREDIVARIERLIKNRENLPLRIDIYGNKFTAQLSREVDGQLREVIKDAGLEQAEAQVCLIEEMLPKTRIYEYVLQQGDIYSKGHSKPMTKSRLLAESQRHIDQVSLLPGRIRFDIAFDRQSKDLALDLEKAIEELTEDSDLTSRQREVELREFEP